ncbi:MAG: aminoacyl-tRNA hydrolase [Lachnospiraceae bacterium]|nr:aminoacyl-tRNA hydrolase [Lachnospiraceae bacterium]
MYIIAGLGNPGREYENTRHNAGFKAIDEIAKKAGIGISEKKHKALIGKGVFAGEKVVLVKPQTYMNLSGESIREVTDYYKVDAESELIVISDDIDLDIGQLRIRPKGSAGGHNGLKNIIQHLGTENFARVRIGVGAKRAGGDLVSHVLGSVAGDDLELYDETIKNVADAVEMMILEGTEKAMNKYNTKKKK